MTLRLPCLIKGESPEQKPTRLETNQHCYGEMVLCKQLGSAAFHYMYLRVPNHRTQ